MVKCVGSYGTPERVEADVHVLFFADDEALFKRAADRMGSPFKSQLADMRERGDFKGAADEMFCLPAGDLRCVLVGLGARENLSAEALRRAAGRGIREAGKFAASTAAIHCPTEDVTKKSMHLSFEDAIQSIVEGTLLGHYRFDKYKMNKSDEPKGKFREFRFVAAEEGFQGRLKEAIELATIIADGVILARDLVNSPPADASPDALAKEAAVIGRKHGLKVVLLGRKEIEQHKMAGLLAVNQGSRREPRFIVMEYNETKRRLPNYVLIGKGVTFDSGGLSLKPAAAMEEMKMDMAGAAAVLGVFSAAVKLKLPIRLVGLIPATDNMPGGNALCPGDIIRYSNGVSVEVLNTDAEGRLILADALIYAQRYKPTGIIDLATLTGACVVALASHATGMLGTDDALKQGLSAAGSKTYERVWELPLFAEYDEMLKSQAADLKNIGGKWGGAITAAAFLKRFAADAPWVHLDIAGTAILDEDTDYSRKGGSGVGVRLLAEFLRNAVQ